MDSDNTASSSSSSLDSFADDALTKYRVDMHCYIRGLYLEAKKRVDRADQDKSRGVKPARQSGMERMAARKAEAAARRA